MGSGMGKARRAQTHRVVQQLPGSYVNGETGHVIIEAGFHLMRKDDIIGVGATVQRRWLRDDVAALHVIVRKGTRAASTLPKSVPVVVDGVGYDLPLVVVHRSGKLD
jgi:hypothetical protein